MKNERKIRKELSKLDINIKAKNGGLRVTPTKCKEIYGVELRAIIAVATKYRRNYYVDFEFGHIRIH